MNLCTFFLGIKAPFGFSGHCPSFTPHSDTHGWEFAPTFLVGIIGQFYLSTTILPLSTGNNMIPCSDKPLTLVITFKIVSASLNLLLFL